ncbi:serine protease [Paucibacter sp. JuS9]|uniref:trypsin-like serine peptidase n=1 Tax=Paucibacter sp. JuS9 TaxID=3228748 RepID=UPI00375802CC
MRLQLFDQVTLLTKLAALGIAATLCACGGGGASSTSSAQGPAPAPSPSSPAAVLIPAAQTDASYNCYDTNDGARCYATSYTLKSSLTASELAETFQGNNTFQNKALLSCKRSVACSIADLAGSISTQQATAMRNAATAVVKLTLPFQSFATNTGNGVSFPGLCSGTVIQNSLDGRVYILTAGHCLYHDAQSFWPSVGAGTYRSNGIPIYATFSFEEPSCGVSPNFSAVGNRTVAATPVFSSYAPYSAANGWNGSPYGSGADIALLQLMEPLPLGVSPVRVSMKPLTNQSNLFTYSHPLGADMRGGAIDGGIVGANGYQYLLRAAKRVIEPGSSGGPLFSYDSLTNAVELRGVLSGSTVADAQNPTCMSSEDVVVTRIDTQSIFLPRYVGPLQ